MRRVVIIGVLLAVLAVGALGYFQVSAYNNRSAAETEITAQKPEVEKCKQNLALFYQAWKRYKADHKGGEPASVEALIPKYIPDAQILLCPTAQRWLSKNKRMSVGRVKVDGHDYPVTYGFKWLIGGSARNSKQLGNKAPLISCDSHREGIYCAVFNKGAGLDAFDAAISVDYPQVLRDAPTLSVDHEGSVSDVKPNKE